MRLSSYLDPKLIFTDIEAGSKEEAIRIILERVALYDKKFFQIKDEITRCVLDREGEISTAMGMGIALPHARVEGFDDFVIALGLLKEPVECQVANLPQRDEVKLFVLIVSEVLRNQRMLKVLSGVTRLATKKPEVLEKIKVVTDPHEILEIIEDAQIEIDGRIVADDVLSSDLVPVSPTDTLDEVARRLIAEERTGLPVVEGSGKFLGEITERELMEFGMPKYTSVMQDLSFLTVGEPFEEYLVNEKIATIEELYRREDVITVDRKAPIMEICFLMVNKGRTRVYVVEDGRYFGMIQRSDIIRKVLYI